MPKPITPLLAADTIIELTDIPGRPIILIERANPPFGWAIPGGFVDVGEIIEKCSKNVINTDTLQKNTGYCQ